MKSKHLKSPNYASRRIQKEIKHLHNCYSPNQDFDVQASAPWEGVIWAGWNFHCKEWTSALSSAIPDVQATAG